MKMTKQILIKTEDYAILDKRARELGLTVDEYVAKITSEFLRKAERKDLLHARS